MEFNESFVYLLGIFFRMVLILLIIKSEIVRIFLLFGESCLDE